MKTTSGCKWNIVNTDLCQIRGYLNLKLKSFRRRKKTVCFPLVHVLNHTFADTILNFWDSVGWIKIG